MVAKLHHHIEICYPLNLERRQCGSCACRGVHELLRGLARSLEKWPSGLNVNLERKPELPMRPLRDGPNK